MDRNFQETNRLARERLRALIESATDEKLSLSAIAGWTVSATLAHIAFWDFRTLHLLECWKTEEIAPSPYDTDAINEAQKPICLALPPRVAADLCLLAAAQVDSALESASDDLFERIQATGVQFNVHRSEHRDYHLHEIEPILRSARKGE